MENFFETIYSFIINIIDGLLAFFGIITDLITGAITLIATLPTWLQAFALMNLGIGIIYIIIGREK